MKKKSFKILIIAIIGIFLMLLFNKFVYAEVRGTLKIEEKTEVYYTMRGGTVGYMSGAFPYYTIDGEIVYCVEPGVQIYTYNYIGVEGLVNSPYSAEVNSKLQLIGFYGYEYPGHQTLRYRMATQALIWETAGGPIVEFWTEKYGYGDPVSVDKEKEEIMKLVNAHYNRPSFNGEEVETYLNAEVVLEDTNNVLSQFEVYDNGGNEVKIEDNKVYITPKVINDSTITLIKKGYDDKTTIFFKGDNPASQKLGLLRSGDPVITKINLNTLGGKVTIEKVDSETGLSVAQGDASLKGAVYGIYDENDVLLEEITTDEYGKATSNYISQLGRLKLREIKSSDGYLVDETVYNFEITSDNLNPKIKVREDVIKKQLSILKLYGSKSTGIYSEEANITFDIYLKSTNKYIKSITTDESGYAKTYLPFGIYIIKQKNTTPDYVKADDFEIKVDSTGSEVINKIVYNYSIEAKLKVIKVDAETNKQVLLSGIKFKIKNLDNGEYVCQKITYPTAKTICEYETDKNGVLITPYELVGNFQLEEVENQLIDGYLWNKNVIKFHIGEGSKFEKDSEYGNLYTIKFANSRVKGKVEINKKGESVVITDGKFSFTKVSLKNVKFGLYANEDIKVNGELLYTKGKLVKEVTTNNDGYAVINNLELGKYYLLELSTDSNHILSTKKYEFELKYKDQYTSVVTETFNIDNYYKKGTLEFTKTDLITGKAVPDATIEIYTENNKLVYNGKTNSEGKIIVNNLFAGKFYIIETIAPEGYVLSQEKAFFQIKTNGEIVKAQMTNEKIKGTLEFTKLDFSTSEPLPDTKIEIYNSSDELVYSGVTDSNGQIIINELVYGKYYIIEKDAPLGYIISEDKMFFEIKTNGEIVKSTMTNEKIKGSLEFTKLDFSTSEPLPDTKIEIYNSSDELVYSGVTDSNGQIIINELEYGKYYIIEKEAPLGYIISEDKMFFEIKTNGEIVKSTMTNEKIKGTLEFTKIDLSTSEPLPNTVIEIYKQITEEEYEKVFEGVTDENGQIIIEELEYGVYYILEKDAPEGYILSEEKKFFEILVDGEIIKSTMTNEKIVIEVPKTSVADSKIVTGLTIAGIIAGIGFLIYDKKRKK